MIRTAGAMLAEPLELVLHQPFDTSRHGGGMAAGSDLGWWGRHPVCYVAFTTVASMLCLAGVVAGVSSRSWGIAATAGLFAALMSFAAVYAWHWWFVGRHRDKSANDRLRWTIDMALLRIGFGFLGLLLFLFAVGAAYGMYDSWRLDRYGVTGNATVERIEKHKYSDSAVVTVGTGDRVRRVEVEGDRDELAIGDRVAIVYDPDPDHNEGVLAGRSPYNRWPIFLLVGAAVLGFFVLTRTGRATIKERGLRHWTDGRGRLRRRKG